MTKKLILSMCVRSRPGISSRANANAGTKKKSRASCGNGMRGVPNAKAENCHHSAAREHSAKALRRLRPKPVRVPPAATCRPPPGPMASEQSSGVVPPSLSHAFRATTMSSTTSCPANA